MLPGIYCLRKAGVIMAYKRLISYFDLIENELKRGNAGFVKWEQYDECHILSVFVSGLDGTINKETKVYLDDSVLGTLSIRGGRAEGTYLLTGEDKEQKEYIERIKETYKSLIDRVREVNPEVKIILCEPFNYAIESPGKEWPTWQPRLCLVQRMVREIAEEKNVFFLPLQQMFDDLCEKAEPSYWIWDGIHPTESGHWMIAQKWLDFVRENDILCLDT